MDEGQQYDLNAMSDQELEDLKEQMEEEKEELSEDQFDLSDDNSFPSPQPDEKQNQHTFIHKAAFNSADTVRTTFLTEGELGRPLFTVRFLLELNSVAKHYFNPILERLKLDPDKNNTLANYFWEKAQNITSSGMSNKGFAMNLNVTQKKDMVRKRIREAPTQQVKGGTK